MPHVHGPLPPSPTMFAVSLWLSLSILPVVAGAAQSKPLPDSTVMARVETRVIRAERFMQAFFDSDAPTRPRPDSLGRVTFLNTMINKEVLALLAYEVNAPLDFAQRSELRDYSNRVISNVLYQRMVIDSIHITEQDIQETYEQFQWEVRLKRIQFADRATAERVRRDLVARKIAWSVAVRRFSTAEDRVRDGDIGWRGRMGVDAMLAAQVFSFKPGQITDVISDPSGYQVVQLVERRPTKAPALEPLRRAIIGQIQNQRAAVRTRQIQKELIAELDVHYDEANCTWASEQFRKSVKLTSGDEAPVLEIDPNLPDFSPTDEGRVLARHRSGQVTVKDLVHSLHSMSPMLRPALETLEAIKIQVDALILEPTMVELAIERGIDKDPLAATLIDQKREELMVTNLFRDSVESLVQITPEQRRKYYEDNKAGYFTYPTVRFVAMVASTRAEADSLKQLLVAGADPAALLRADSLAGRTRGSIQTRSHNEHGPYHKVLFEEMRPGNVVVEGPDRQGSFGVIQLLNYDGGRQLEFREVEQLVDESMRNIESERRVKELIARHRPRYKVEAHPERVMAIDFRAP